MLYFIIVGIWYCLFYSNCYFGKNSYRSILILTLVSEGNIDIYNGIKKLYSPTLLKEIKDIEEWLGELQIWQCVTDSGKKTQGPVVYLSLTGKIRKSWNDILKRDLNKDDGFIRYSYMKNQILVMQKI